MNIPTGFERLALLETAALHSDIDSACAVIQRAIGQDDGGVAGVFFSDADTAAEYESAPDIYDRVLILGAYLNLEAAHSAS